MRSLRVRIRLGGIRTVQPSDEIRKEDYKMMIYEKKVGDRIVAYPISPAQFKGALRHVACIVVQSNPDLKQAYEDLFGTDVAGRCFGKGEVLSPISKRGKLSFEIESCNISEDIYRLVELRPRIKLDRELGVVEKGALLFSQVISSRLEVIFLIESSEDLNEKEIELLRKSLNALVGWGIGGWTCLGYGNVEEVRADGI